MDSELPGVTGASSNPAHFPGRTLGLQKYLSSTQTMKSILDGEAAEAQGYEQCLLLPIMFPWRTSEHLFFYFSLYYGS